MAIWPGSDQQNVIVQTRTVIDAPTGEGTHYKTADGRWWRPCGISEARTGVVFGCKVGNEIRTG